MFYMIFFNTVFLSSSIEQKDEGILSSLLVAIVQKLKLKLNKHRNLAENWVAKQQIKMKYTIIHELA